MTPSERDTAWKEIEKLNFSELCQWLKENFTIERYRLRNDDVVRGACSQLFAVVTKGEAFALLAYHELWADCNELPDYLPNFDYYGRLTTWRPNYDKPGMAQRVLDEVDAMFDDRILERQRHG